MAEYETACATVLLQSEDAYGFHFTKSEEDGAKLSFCYFGPLSVEQVEKQEVGGSALNAKMSDAASDAVVVADASGNDATAAPGARARPPAADRPQERGTNVRSAAPATLAYFCVGQ